MTAPSPRAPQLIGVALCLVVAAWGVERFADAVERETFRHERLAASLAATLAVALDPATAGERPAAELAATLAARLRLRRPLLFVRIVRDGQVLATLGEVPPGLTDPTATGPSADGRTEVVARRLDLAFLPTSDAWRWQPSPALPTTTAYLGLETSLPRRLYTRTAPEIAAVVLLGWACVAALMLAWQRQRRSRQLQHALEIERGRRAHFEEMSLAAAGLAHETRNPLGLILGLAQRIARDGATPAPTAERARQIIDAADRATSGLSDFMAFARGTPLRPQPTRADGLIGRVVEILRADFDEAAVHLTADIPAVTITCTPTMLEQILVNLLLNALQSSEAGTQVRVVLTVVPPGGSPEVGESKGFWARVARWLHPDAPPSAPGPVARLEVIDQGCGIPADRLPHITKPYVTHRADGHGLGLAIVRRMVEQHGWSLKITSQTEGPSRGTRVSIDGIALEDP